VATYPPRWCRDALDIDLAVTAQAALFMALLVRSRGFAVRRWAIAAGVAAGLAMLTKWTFPVFVGGPALYMLWRAWRAGGDRRRLAANVGLAALCCLLVASTWWAYKWHDVLFDYLQWVPATGPSEGDPQLLTEPFWALNYYIVGLNYQLTFYGCLLLAIGTPIFYAARKAPAWQKIALGAWIVLPYVWLTVVANKEPRYFEPAYPAMALITAAAIWQVLERIRRPWGRAVVVGIVAAVALFQFYSISFPISWVKANTFVPRVPNDGHPNDRQHRDLLSTVNGMPMPLTPIRRLAGGRDP
jgi:4-amino-4-deoxy-L-arabinose transferase-like glycosyltransferase